MSEQDENHPKEKEVPFSYVQKPGHANYLSHSLTSMNGNVLLNQTTTVIITRNVSDQKLSLLIEYPFITSGRR